MRIIYADTLALWNAAVDYVLLLCAGKLCALPLRRGRMALGALWGGVYAVLAAARPAFWALWTVKLAAGALIVLLAYGAQARTPRALVAFYAAGACFGGAVRFLSSLRGTPAAANAPVPGPVLLLSFALCYGVAALVFRHVGRERRETLHAVTVTRQGRSVRLRALEDSGNALVDPLTGDGVLVADAAALAPCAWTRRRRWRSWRGRRGAACGCCPAPAWRRRGRCCCAFARTRWRSTERRGGTCLWRSARTG